MFDLSIILATKNEEKNLKNFFSFLGNDNKKDTQLTNSITNNTSSSTPNINNFDPEMITKILNNMKNQK